MRIIILIFIISILSLYVYVNRKKVQYVRYSQSSSASYDVYLKDNDFYKTNNLKENIQNYGRMFTNDNGENVLSVHLYEKEASTLIMLFSVFISSVTEIEHDYFAELEERYNDRRAAAEAD